MQSDWIYYAPSDIILYCDWFLCLLLWSICARIKIKIHRHSWVEIYNNIISYITSTIWHHIWPSAIVLAYDRLWESLVWKPISDMTVIGYNGTKGGICTVPTAMLDDLGGWTCNYCRIRRASPNKCSKDIQCRYCIMFATRKLTR